MCGRRAGSAGRISQQGEPEAGADLGDVWRRESLKREPISEMSGGGTYGQPEGTWSDDGSLTLCLAQSIGETGGVHAHDIMERFLDWYENGKYSPWGERFDCGIATAQALYRYKEGVEPVLCGGNKVSSNGNGSLMRILPAAYYLYFRFGADLTKSRKAMDIVHKASALTHRHAIALRCLPAESMPISRFA